MSKKPLREWLEYLHLSTRQLIVLFGGLFLLSMLVTLIVLITTRPGAGPPAADAETIDYEPMMLHQFLLPTAEPAYTLQPHAWRKRIPRWSQEQIDRYWIPLNKIVLEIIIKENDRRIDAIFEEIP